MKSKALLFWALCWVLSISVAAQTWTAPAVPGADLTTLSSETFVYAYNVEANAVISYGMDWGTNACATRLTNGESAASIPQRCYAFVNGTKVSIRLVDKGESYISCLSGNANDVYTDQDQNREFTFAETATGSHVYTLTNTTYNLPLDVYWARGGHLTITGGQGYTKWAFITESDVTSGLLAKYRARLCLYNVYKAIVDAGKASTYASEITTAATTYNNSNASVANLQSAARTLFNASAAQLAGPLDVSFLFDNADMAATGNCTSWTSTEKNIAWGEFEQYHGAITLTQTKTVPQGIYDVVWRSLFRQDGTDAAPTLKAVGENTVIADVPNLSTIDFGVGNANTNGWTGGENYVQPNDMKSASEALLCESSQALAHNVSVASNGSLTLTASMPSTSQWLNWQGIQVIYRGNSIAPLKTELQTVISKAEAAYNSTYKGAADLKQQIDAAKAVYNNSSATVDDINTARTSLEAAIETFAYVSATVDHPLEYTSHIKNPSFENGFNQWTNSNMQTQGNNGPADGWKDGNTYVEKWVAEGNALGDASVSQTLTGLEMGKFILKAKAFNILQSNTSATQSGAWIFGNIDRQAVGVNGEYTLVWVNIEENPTIGFVAEGPTGNWMGCDHFQLYYAGGELSDFQTELQKYINDAQSVQGGKMNQSVRSQLETAISNAQTEKAKSTANGYPAVARALKEAKAAALESTRAYQALQEAITLAEGRYDASLQGADQYLASINEAKALNNSLSSTNEQLYAEVGTLNMAYRRMKLANASGTAPTVVTDTRYVRGCVEAFGRMSVSGGDDIMEQGFCYSTTNSEPTILDQYSTDYLDWNGRIYRMPMQPGTIYYMRAYAMTSNYAVGYGDVIKMSTLPQGNVTYWYNNGGDQAQNDRINNALTEACYWWTNYTSIRGFNVSCVYSPGTPTADCGYGGNMRMGTNMGQRAGTCMHEMNHGVGCGTLGIWGGWENSFLRTSMNGDWAGERANAALRFWENRNDLVICGAYDNAHWGFRPFNGVYEEGGGNTAIWENKYAFNGAHLEPGAWAGPKDWNGTQAVYIGNSIITQGMMEDGLIPVNAWSGGFCLPAYVFPQIDNQKYYLKCEDKDRGLLTSFLVENNDGTLAWTTNTGDDRSAWYISFNAATQYYQFRNAATGHYIKFNDGGTNGFRANGSNGTTDTEQFHLMRGRKDVTVDGEVFEEGLHGYWMMRINDGSAPRALTADANGATSANAVNLWDNGTKQRWLFVPVDDMDNFEQDIIDLNLNELRRLIAGFKTAKSVQHEQLVANADKTFDSSVNGIENAIAGNVTLEQVNGYISQIMTDGLAFLNNTKPSGTIPYDLTFLLANADFDKSTQGWSLDPVHSYGAVEFYQTNFDLYQTLHNMPAGTYQLTAGAFQRPGQQADVYTAYQAGTDNVNASLYINSTAEKIKNIMAGQQSASIANGEYTTEGNTYVPDNMESGSAYLNAGKYANSIQGEFAAGDLRIGLRGTTGNGYWVMADNFRLYYFGTNGEVLSLKDQLATNGFTKITQLPDDYSPYFFVLYDHEQDLALVEKDPVNQGGSKSVWYDADANPMTHKQTLWTLDAFEQDGTGYQILSSATNPDFMLQTEWNAGWNYRCSDNGAGYPGWGRTKYDYLPDGYWTIQNGVYPEAGYLGAWNNVIADDAETALNKQGADVGHFDVFSILRGDYVKRFETGLDEATQEQPVDITYVLENPGAERRTNLGWKIEGGDWWYQGNDGLSGRVGGYYMERWDAGGAGSTEIYQTIQGLPDGCYRFSALGFVQGEGQTFYLYANDKKTALTNANDGTRFNAIAQVTDGTLRVGFKAESVTAQWIAFDDAQLEYLGSAVFGDVDEDGDFDMDDARAVVHHLVGRTPQKFDHHAADVNNDGGITLADVTALINILTNQQ